MQKHELPKRKGCSSVLSVSVLLANFIKRSAMSPDFFFLPKVSVSASSQKARLYMSLITGV